MTLTAGELTQLHDVVAQVAGNDPDPTVRRVAATAIADGDQRRTLAFQAAAVLSNPGGSRSDRLEALRFLTDVLLRGA